MASDGTIYIPRYRRIINDLKADVDTGAYTLGQKLPSEAELCILYDVSRITVRRALQELVQEGYLIRRRGRGTFVSQPNVLHILERENIDTSVFSYSAACRACGYEPGARPIMCEPVKAPLSCQRLFGISPAESVLCVERVRTANGTPILIERNLFRRRDFDFLQHMDLANVSLFDTIEQRIGNTPKLHEACSLEVVRSTIEMANDLGISPGEPLVCLAGSYYDLSEAPLFYGELYIVGSRYRFTV